MISGIGFPSYNKKLITASMLAHNDYNQLQVCMNSHQDQAFGEDFAHLRPSTAWETAD
jgi:hypothetical protein